MSAKDNIEIWGKQKLTVSPGTSLQVNCYIAGNSLNSLQRPLWSTFVGISGLLPSDVIDFAILPTQRFWQETVLLLDVMWPWSDQWDHAMLEKKFQLYNNDCYQHWSPAYLLYIKNQKEHTSISSTDSGLDFVTAGVGDKTVLAGSLNMEVKIITNIAWNDT